jgi:hypothetical protein
MNCPVCQGEPVTASAWEVRERLALMHLIPIGPVQVTTFVKCPKCRQTFLSQVSLPELHELAPDQIANAIRARESLPAQLFAALSVLMFWVPVVGSGIGLIAVLWNRKSASWTRTTSIVGFVLSLLGLAALYVMTKLKIIS